jgi:hypothetical protein
MCGGGGSTYYEDTRTGVDRRRYGELSKTGFTSKDAYENALEGTSLKQSDFTKTIQVSDGNGGYQTKIVEDVDAFNSALADKGLTYNKTYGRYSLTSGVDLDAAKTDWQNYTIEREDIATNSAKEARRIAAPEDLTGTSGKVDYSLGIKDDKEDDKLSTPTTTYDESASTASTSQALGIY